MFGKKNRVQEEEATIVTPAPQYEPKATPAPKTNVSVIAAQTIVNGSLNSIGDLNIDGSINGDVKCANLSIGANGEVNGNITAEKATIRGFVKGNVTARTILLAGSGNIEGDLTHSVLIIEEGGTFEGRSKRIADPLAAQTPAIEAPKTDPTENTESSLAEEIGDVFKN